MAELSGAVVSDMISYNAGDARRIAHALKVYSFAKTIGVLENLNSETQQTLELSAILHDIGIHMSEQKYGSSAGNYQELEGPPIARRLLQKYELPADMLERICFLIGHHHTYHKVDGIDYQILLEADFLVNAYEDSMSQKQIASVREKVFKTKTGILFLDKIYKGENEF
jgi:HD superfamily phosphodiesterase